MRHKIFSCALFGALLALTGCQAISTEVEYHQMITQTKMSNSVFLNPISAKDRIVFVQVTNTSNQQDIALTPLLIADLQKNGWTVTDDLDKAQQLLQVNILQAGQTTPAAVNDSLVQGYGAAAAGAVVGAVASNGDAATTVGAGVATGLASTVANAMVQDITVSLTSDVRISVRLPKGSSITETSTTNLSQGSKTNVASQYQTTSDWQVYQTRVISTANQANLKFEDARDEITKELAESIAGIF